MMVKLIHAAHILVKTENEARAILGEIKNGANFQSMARLRSTCPSAKKGGDLGWFGRGQMIKEFEKAAFEGKEGEIIGPIKTQFGWHLIKILGKK